MPSAVCIRSSTGLSRLRGARCTQVSCSPSFTARDSGQTRSQPLGGPLFLGTRTRGASAQRRALSGDSSPDRQCLSFSHARPYPERSLCTRRALLTAVAQRPVPNAYALYLLGCAAFYHLRPVFTDRARGRFSAIPTGCGVLRILRMTPQWVV